MVDVDATCERHDTTTLVRGLVTNTRSTPQRVRLRSRLEGPTLAPKRADREWDGDVWTGIVRPGRTRGIGFASPAPPVDTPVAVVDTRRADDESIDRLEFDTDFEAWKPTAEVVWSGR